MAVPVPTIPQPVPATPLLEVRDLRTWFYRRGRWGARSQEYVPAVDGVSFALREGETLGIVGESGSGKTTLGRTILGLTRPTGGSVRYRGRELVGAPVRELRAVRREMQMIFQDLDAALNPKMTVGQLLAEALTLYHKRDKHEVRGRSEELLDLVKLKPSKLAAFPPELSGGEKRRVSIARVLAVEPKLIIADEPLSALDVSIAAQVANLLRELQERLGLTYLFISHDLRMVELIAHRVIVMYFGQVVESAAASRLARGGAHPYSRLLWSAVDPHGGRRLEGAVSWEGERAEAGERPRSGCRFRARCSVYHDRGSPAQCHDPATEPVLQERGPDHRAACHFPVAGGG
jgi:peptide/nickel transport system ATP-binding protein